MDRTDSQHPSQSITTGGERVDRLLSLLEHRYRRYIVQRLRIAECPMPIDQLATEIAAREKERPVNQISQEDADQIRTTLYHVHLPKLEDESIIEYDRASGEIFLMDQRTEFESFLEAITESAIVSTDG
ncbi:DUF7344 domain-containing protein [Natronococcus wangiae]|uniref:DUF7344 domain-containing protein n=1 Tax=Natronococcus wangiae TaxID=3068275 RepID=UPI00273D7198|nr:hypothetical protein [Natronococcus sp. AD5]